MNIYPYWVLRNLREGSETESVSGEEFPDWGQFNRVPVTAAR